MDYCEAYWNKRNLEDEKERRSRIFKVMLMKKREMASAAVPKFCPICHMQLTDNGHCVNGCDD